jgi:hypothetical protein
MSQKTTSRNVLEPEIALLREILHDLKKHYRRAKDLRTRLAIADRIALFASRISQLARAQHHLCPPPDPFLVELDAACEAVTKEWPLMDLFRPSRPSPPSLDPPPPNLSPPPG